MNALSRVCLGLGVMAGLAVPLGSAVHATAITAGNHYFEGSDRTSQSVPTKGTCISTGFCYLIFNEIPAGKQLVVTDVSCEAQVLGNKPVLTSTSLVTSTSANTFSDRQSFVPPTLVHAYSATHARFQVVGKPRHVFKAGERPVMRFLSAGGTNFGIHCSISGTVGNPPE